MDKDLPPLTRREFVATLLATGFALATQPVAASTIHTDTTGLTAGTVQIPTADRQIPAYRAMPSKGSAFPVILVVQEIFGVHEHIKDVCRRLAKLGYMAIAPELYVRQGDVASLSEISDIQSKVVSKVPDAQVMSDLDATVAWAKTSSQGDIGKLGITGFCWGGRIVWLYCAHNPNVKAGVAWYGRLVGSENELTPRNPIDIAATLKVPVLGLYGGADQGIPADTVERMRTALKVSNSHSEIIVYPNTPHAFNADYRPSYRKSEAEDGWARMQTWFKKYGVA
jgi:carboxymethylenebutenolidase